MEPVLSSLVYFAVVIAFCELCRRGLDGVYGRGSRPPRSIKGFLTEAIGTLQAITCVFENQLIAKYYGLLGFAMAVFVLLNLHRLTNRGAILSPPALIEKVFVAGHLGLFDAVAVFLAELCGAALAFRLAQLVWRLGISPDHASLADSFQCVLSHKVPLMYVAVYEFIGVFAIRTLIGVIGRRKPSFTPYAAAAAVSCGLAAGFALVGPVALNPIVAYGRLAVCRGLGFNDHIITYWAAPTAGWIVASLVEMGYTKRVTKVRKAE